MRRGAIVAVIGAALSLPAPAGAHVIASPTFVASGATQTIELSVPNERDAPMTSFVVTAPAGLEIASTEESAGWVTSVNGQTATWSGGSLEPKLAETFGLTIRASVAPGALALDAEQRYADGTVRWPVSLTIVPGSGDAARTASSTSWAVVAVVVAIGVLVAAAIAGLAWRRRASDPGSRT